MSEAVFILGVSMTPFAKCPEKSVKQLTREAVSAALADAGLAAGDLDSAIFANYAQGHMEGQIGIPGQVALRACGIGGIPIVNVENACASGSSALYLAVNLVRSGAAKIALAVGAEKMFSADKAATFSLFRGAWDVHDEGRTMAALRQSVADISAPSETASGDAQRSEFMEIYAALAKQHMRRFGLTQRQLAIVAAKNHFHSTFNPLSQYRTALSEAEILGARLIDWPLTLPMCSPISDGAAAAIVCNASMAKRLRSPRTVKIEAIVLASAGERNRDDLDRHVTRRAALKAYEEAGLGPEDMSVAEVHDATAMGEIIQVENLGFCEIGAGGYLAESGATRLGGRLPVNPSGGLESKGHPLGATGLGQIYELVTQLRGEAGGRQVEKARYAIAENGGGFNGVEEVSAVISILGNSH